MVVNFKYDENSKTKIVVLEGNYKEDDQIFSLCEDCPFKRKVCLLPEGNYVSEAVKTYLPQNAENFETVGMVRTILMASNVDINLKGAGYLEEAILIVLSNNEGKTILLRDVYPLIAEKHNVKIGTVKRDIAFAIKKASRQHEKERNAFKRRIPYEIQYSTTAKFISNVIVKIKNK